MSPRFEHRCPCCHFVGNYHDVKQGQDYDLYACTGEPTVVVRYSDRVPDYVDGVEFFRSHRAMVAGWAATQRLFKAGELPAHVAAVVPVIRQQVADHREWKRRGRSLTGE